jgi:hypothetical protein
METRASQKIQEDQDDWEESGSSRSADADEEEEQSDAEEEREDLEEEAEEAENVPKKRAPRRAGLQPKSTKRKAASPVDLKPAKKTKATKPPKPKAPPPALPIARPPPPLHDPNANVHPVEYLQRPTSNSHVPQFATFVDTAGLSPGLEAGDYAGHANCLIKSQAEAWAVAWDRAKLPWIMVRWDARDIIAIMERPEYLYAIVQALSDWAGDGLLAVCIDLRDGALCRPAKHGRVHIARRSKKMKFSSLTAPFLAPFSRAWCRHRPGPIPGAPRIAQCVQREQVKNGVLDRA